MMLAADIPLPIGDLVSDANAVFGVRRRVVRRGVVIGAAASNSAAATATAQQQSATAQQQSVTAQQQAPASNNTAVSGGALPIGTIVNTLPSGCASKPINGVEYYYCGKNYYRAAFQGNNLVYVTAQP